MISLDTIGKKRTNILNGGELTIIPLGRSNNSLKKPSLVFRFFFRIIVIFEVNNIEKIQRKP